MPDKRDFETALATVRAALETEQAARAAHEKAVVEVAQAIRNANEAGISWAAMSKELGMTVAQLRWRSYADDAPASVANRRTPGSSSGTVRRRTAAPGTVGVAEAARRINKSRQWIYRLVESGKLRGERDSAGYLRIDEDSLNTFI